METGSESEVEDADCWVAWMREGRKKLRMEVEDGFDMAEDDSEVVGSW